ncbi:MAG TPA: 2-succinyl-5-enolpyruvyl-6-hydroxy-3-cyclohexene-1-carboxylic-acid synthase [Crocinitomicaceae bacterium]|nr:2-succinyl-5-enolpyruvyl-6-hydroxy-3-cyclohexene-1-carboxylic-acid synthase [Crocinitomicaceae bacterium]
MAVSSSKKGVQLLVSHFVQLGIKHIVFSPGSRNAPLVIAFNNHTFFSSIVIPDERSAAFYALGMAQQLNEPVALVCTSGSAVLNYYPAVAEAFYQNIPLIVLSADRPLDWIDQGDGQTIRQENVLKNHVRYYTALRENHHSNSDLLYNSREIATAFHHCNGTVKGPVHINFPFTEPLYGKEEFDNTLEQIKPTQIADNKQLIPNEELIRLKESWKNTAKIMVLVGQHQPNPQLLNALKALNNLPNVAIVAENTSNMIDRDFVNCIDRTLNGIAENEQADFAPELLITLGGAIVSKKIKQYFRTFKPKEHWKIGHEFPYMDTYQSLTKSIQMNASDFIELLGSFPSNSNSNFGNKWKQKDFIQEEKAREYLFNLDTFCDLKVFDLLLDCVPEDSHLHLANSSVVRYSQLFTPIRSINYWCNRGTSGIDGSMSTAAGASLISKNKAHTLIIGDMSFFYDSNAFWQQLKLSNLRVFLINNGGGDIFNIIQGPNTTTELDINFVYKHTFNAEGICQAYNVRYFKATTLQEIENRMAEFYTETEDGAFVMEIFTNEVNNSSELKKLMIV